MKLIDTSGATIEQLRAEYLDPNNPIIVNGAVASIEVFGDEYFPPVEYEITWDEKTGIVTGIDSIEEA